MLGDLAGWARDLVVAAGLAGIFLAMVVENVFPPIPSEVVLPLAGFESARGELPLPGVVVAATLGSLVGALVLYWLGRYGGRPAIDRWGKVLRVTDKELALSEGWFSRWGTAVVLVARVVPLARSVVSIPAGMMRMPLGRFVGLTTLGSLAWNILLIGAGHQLGSRWEEVSDLVGRSSELVLLAAIVGVLGAGVILFSRRRKALRRSGGEQGPPGQG
jgi:membrane protein DedA with SNARE-associated domain